MSLEITKSSSYHRADSSSTFFFLTPLRLIPSILIRQKYYITHFHFDNKLLIKQKSLIKKSSYILFHDETIFI